MHGNKLTFFILAQRSQNTAAHQNVTSSYGYVDAYAVFDCTQNVPVCALTFRPLMSTIDFEANRIFPG